MKNKTLSWKKKLPIQFSWCEFVAKTTYFSSSTGKQLQVKEGAFSLSFTEAGISKNYYATNSVSPEVELRFCPRLILFKY
jgi:hypothetical protein